MKTKIKKSKIESKPAEVATCDYCGAEVETDRDRLECWSCLRPGCHRCMPAGRDCLCPQCEDGEPVD